MYLEKRRAPQTQSSWSVFLTTWKGIRHKNLNYDESTNITSFLLGADSLSRPNLAQQLSIRADPHPPHERCISFPRTQTQFE